MWMSIFDVNLAESEFWRVPAKNESDKDSMIVNYSRPRWQWKSFVLVFFFKSEWISFMKRQCLWLVRKLENFHKLREAFLLQSEARCNSDIVGLLALAPNLTPPHSSLSFNHLCPPPPPRSPLFLFCPPSSFVARSSDSAWPTRPLRWRQKWLSANARPSDASSYRSRGRWSFLWQRASETDKRRGGGLERR